MSLSRFLSQPLGRGLRVVVGLVLIGLGLFAIKGAVGVVIAIIGLVPLAAGAFNICLVGPLVGGHLRGRENV